MSRPLRIEFPGAIYHVTSRGNAHQVIFSDDQDREQYLAILAETVARYGWICHAYCLMDNHYHLLIETPKANLSLGMRHLNGRYTQNYNRRHERVGHLLQGRFKAILVEKEAHLLELCRYVVLNPVRARAAKHPGKWRWSSYNATAGEEGVPGYLTIDWILGQYAERLHPAQKKYREYVVEGIKSPSPWEKLQGQIYLGSKDFVKKHQPDRVIQEVPRRQSQAHRPELEELLKGEDTSRAISDAYRHGYRLIEIANHFGVHYSTISRRLRREEEKPTRDCKT